jgi:hypothetical protein
MDNAGLEGKSFSSCGMAKSISADETAFAATLAGVRIQLLSTVKDKARARRRLARHHYLGDVRAVGEQLFYAVISARGDWLGVLVFCAASRRLRARDRWIGWSEETALGFRVMPCHRQEQNCFLTMSFHCITAWFAYPRWDEPSSRVPLT